MSDCDTCRATLDQLHSAAAEPGAANPDEVAFASTHAAECEPCRNYAARLEQPSPAADPEQLERVRERLRRRIRLAIAGPIAASVVMLAAAGFLVVEAVQRGEVFPWGLLAGYLGWLFIDSLREIRMHRRNADRFMQSGDLVERCQGEMEINRGLNLTLGVIHLVLALVVTILACFVWPTRVMLVIAVGSWLLVAYNLFRAFVLPKPWNGVAA